MPSASQLISSAQTYWLRRWRLPETERRRGRQAIVIFSEKWPGCFQAMLNLNQATLRQLDADWPPSSQSSAESLQRNATTFGLPDGAGGYGFWSQSQRWAVWELCKAHQEHRFPCRRRLSGLTG